MDGSGERGVLFVAMGTVATLGMWSSCLKNRLQVLLASCCTAGTQNSLSIAVATSCWYAMCGVPVDMCGAAAGLEERQAMAAAFAELPVRVLWRLSKTEVPDQTAVDGLHLGNNTKARTLTSIALLSPPPEYPGFSI